MVKSIINLSCTSGKGIKFYTENDLEARAPNITIAFKIFDSRIAPILFYGAEIWGSEGRNQIEKIHLRFCNLCLEWAKMRTQQQY